MKERHFFAGNNTSKGFHSFFDYIISSEEAEHIYILKGGPGVGKSSFMKKFISRFQAKGYDLEYIHCSSDNDSLDAIVIPCLKIAMVDGTAPHTIDPKFPGIIDEIINLGQFIDVTKLQANKLDILQTNKAKSNAYKSAYRYLECANIIIEEINSIYDRATNDLKFTQIAKDVIDSIYNSKPVSISENLYNKSNSGKQGYLRKLFSDAITADGYISFIDSLCKGNSVWMIVGQNTNYVSKLLDRIAGEALKRGHLVEGFYRPLNPDKLQHILIPELNLIFRSSDKPIEGSFDEVIDLNPIIDIEILNSYKMYIENNLELYDIMLENAYSKLQDTRKYHSILENYYVKSMDFNGVDALFDRLFPDLKI
ncbi:MAG: hypothetical protein GX288_03505 [Clostridiales bacterium]|nr:hypothetical protein [Clostridiales bacterium]